ncbi:DUF262 domain-containing protein [Epilithonimonas ginsengisoli]|uniref:DUF262 domain-containing protein n=1 Tax=Epilithonimonas ginsengisoli TaxID=1245592 RepID=A0ABU4JGS9_9FLAO|nr:MULTISPECIES: DUF262 domain-containing protein [Chryseobacterium group]MBV6878796.1 DUF262 domain-containing protein [Epilithonimonas sp. FP105]MDW8548873.1 DUF262 domain-containing protein [Epilithonimonas ginsengisoli]OAH72352.1 hypothetical protein AXA65_10450 [Chryseobacterium sp. FP211-J200]
MSNNPTSKLLTFQSLISDCKYEVVLPIIQRDYAQGREGKEELRENFLNSLHGAVTTGEKLELDFVYGDVRKGIFKPLDGQQRLTTLFLLHWYAATKNPSITNTENILSKFTYETRTSSREFCENLVSKGINYDETKSVSELIVDSSWFFLSWKRDPTIQSMLKMLDAIHEKFKAENETLWDRLNNISFHFIELQDFGLSDDLYIKMNARGKPLTEFENFKAKFEQFIEHNKWEDRMDLKDTFAHKIDTVWTDLFWKHRKTKKSLIDFEILTFFSALAIESYALNNNDEKVRQLYNNPSQIKVEDFENKDLFDYLLETLDLYSKENFDCLKLEKVPMWNYNNDSTLFLEIIKNNSNDINGRYIGATYAQRILFAAQTKYLIDNQNIDENFQNWMRFARNIVEHSTIDSPTTYINAIKALYTLLPFKVNILQNLKDGNCDNVRFFGTQIKEEKIKAILILNNPGMNWNMQIDHAEDHGLFRGNIGFLFNNAENSNFDIFKKWKEKAFEFFYEKGVTNLYKTNSILMRSLISRFDKWGLLWDKMPFDSSKENWSRLLKNSKIIFYLQIILDTERIEDLENMVLQDSNMGEPTHRLVHEDLYKSLILNVIPEGSFLRWEYNNYILYPYNTRAEWKKYVIGNDRNKILSEHYDKISTDQRLKFDEKLLSYFWGWDIYFQYQNIKYVWKYNDKIINVNTDKEEIIDLFLTKI